MIYDPSLDRELPEFDWAMLPAALVIIGLSSIVWIGVFGVPEWIVFLSQ